MFATLDSSLGLRPTPVPFFPWQQTPALLHAGFGCDPDVAVAALVAGPQGRFLAIDAHGGGETALALVSRGAACVLAVPMLDLCGAGTDESFGNPVLGLKVAAIRRLDREDYLRFVGLRRSSRARRAAAYVQVRLALSPGEQAFWDRHEVAITHGLFLNEADVAQGRLLRHLLRTHLSKPTYRKLLYAERAERVETFDRFIAGRRFWENALRMCAVRGQVTVCAEGEASPLTCSDPMNALRRLVEAGPATCPVWVRAFTNDAGVEDALPWHLGPQGYEALKANLDALHIVPDALAALTSGRPAFDAFDLTRAHEGLTSEGFAHLLGTAVAHARPGARFMVTASAVHGLALDDVLVADVALETHVTGCDRAPGGAPRRVLRRR